MGECVLTVSEALRVKGRSICPGRYQQVMCDNRKTSAHSGSVALREVLTGWRHSCASLRTWLEGREGSEVVASATRDLTCGSVDQQVTVKRGERGPGATG